MQDFRDYFSVVCELVGVLRKIDFLNELE